MNCLKLPCFLLISLCVFSGRSFSQEAITGKDAGEITYRAELIIHELKDLLNIISNGQTDIKETKDLIVNSYNNSRNKIFYDSLIMIEDDLNPTVRNAESSKDIPVFTYLTNFDLFYSKSDSSSVDFSEYKISNVKRGEYIYVKVNFIARYKNKSSLSDSMYAGNKRIAEIRFEKVSNKWTGAIMHIGFSPVQDLAADTVNDVKVSYAVNTAENGDLLSSDSTLAEADAKTFEEKLKEKERLKQVEAYKQEKKAYDQLVERGDKLLAQAEYASAAKIFTEAQELKPYEIYPKIKLAQIRKQAEQAAVSSGELFNQFISKARIAENARKYEQAKGFYMDAFSQKPEEANNFADHLRQLNQKIRIISELEEKYISGLYKEAIKDYEAAIKKDNTNSDYYLGRGKCFDKLNDYARALKDYSKAIDLDNNNLEAIQLRADLYRRNNESFKALADYKIYLTVDKTNVDIYTELSDIHILTNNIKAALEDLDNALKVNPKSPRLYYKKGLLLLRQKEYTTALEAFNVSIELDSSSADPYYYRGESKLFANRTEAAANDFNSARKLRLDSNKLGNIIDYAAAFYQLAQQNFQAKKVDSALRNISDGILLNPVSKEYRFTRGEYYFEQKNYKEAITNYDYAIKLDTKYQQAFYKRGMSYYLLNEFAPAIENFYTSSNLNTQDYLSLKGLGEAYFQTGDYQNTVTSLENCVNLITAKKNNDPEFLPEVYNTLATCYIKLTNYEKAIATTKSAIRLNSSFGEAYFNRGYAYYKSGSLDMAVEDIVKALSFEQHLLWNYTLAKVFFNKGEYAKAIYYYDNTIKEDSLSEISGIFYERGICNFKLFNYAAALPDYLASVKSGIDSNYIEFNNQLGSIYLNLNKYDSAKIAFGQSLSKDSADINALYGMASLHYLQNNTTEALIWFEKLFKNKAFNANVIKKDKLILGIRDDKNFKALIKKYN